MITRLIQKMLFPEYQRYLHWHFNKFGKSPSKVTVCFDLFEKFYSGQLFARIHLNELKHNPVVIRLGGSDKEVFNQIFLKREYDIKISPPKTIIDAGANIGLSTVYFANKYPQAKIIAIEPDQNNYEMLKRNTKAYSNVDCLQVGLWNKATRLKLVSDKVESWAFQFEETDDDNGIPAVCLDDLAQSLPGKNIDLLKIDIEGSEIVVFEQGAAWLNNVSTIIVECHDFMIENCTDVVLNAVDKQNFSRSQSGENLVLIRVS